MVFKREKCAFSEYNINPGQGKLFIRGDGKSFRFIRSKEESLFLQRKDPRRLSWTVLYRRVHRKGITAEVAKKRTRKTVKHQRGIVGADFNTIMAKRQRNASERQAEQEAALKKAKEERKKAAEEKRKATKASGASRTAGGKVARTKIQSKGAQGGAVRH